MFLFLVTAPYDNTHVRARHRRTEPRRFAMHLVSDLDRLVCQVDSVYYVSFGRRKSWLVPAQVLCGGMMLWARSVMDDWIGEDGGSPHIKTLTAYFLALYFIMATQVCAYVL